MAKIIVSNDWKTIKFSQKFKNKLWRKNDLDDNYGSWRTDEEVINLLLELQGESFEELHDGVRIVEYDENKCHPVIEEEEYGGENLYFAQGKGEIEWGYTCSYNPVSGECDEDSPYNSATDQYQTSESDVTGSRQLAEKIVSYYNGHKKKVLKNLMQYSSCRLHDIEKAAILQTDEQLDAYFYMFCCCSKDFVNRDYMYIWALMFTKDQIADMSNKFRYAKSNLNKHVEPYMELLKKL